MNICKPDAKSCRIFRVVFTGFIFVTTLRKSRMSALGAWILFIHLLTRRDTREKTDKNQDKIPCVVPGFLICCHDLGIHVCWISSPPRHVVVVLCMNVWWAERYEPNSIGQNKTTQPLQPSFSYLIFGCFVCAEPHVVCLLFHDAWKLSLKGTVLRQVLWSRRENVRNIFCLARLHWFVFVHSHARRFSYRAWKYIFENVSLELSCSCQMRTQLIISVFSHLFCIYSCLNMENKCP